MGRGRGLASASVKPNGVREGATGQRKAKRGEGGSWPVRKGKRGGDIWMNRERERRSSGSPLPPVWLLRTGGPRPPEVQLLVDALGDGPRDPLGGRQPSVLREDVRLPRDGRRQLDLQA